MNKNEIEIKPGDTLVVRVGGEYYTYTIVIKPDDSSRNSCSTQLGPYGAC